jgi:hypothetical protein
VLDRLDEAAEQEAKFRADLIREAVLFYMAENPDGIYAFADVSHPARRRTSSEPEIDEAGLDPEGVLYDPMEEL